MLAPWNRRELAVFSTLSRCEAAAEALRARGIPYRVKVVSRSSPSVFSAGTRERAGTFGQAPVQETYSLFVHRRDYDAAAAAIGRR